MQNTCNEWTQWNLQLSISFWSFTQGPHMQNTYEQWTQWNSGSSTMEVLYVVGETGDRW